MFVRPGRVPRRSAHPRHGPLAVGSHRAVARHRLGASSVTSAGRSSGPPSARPPPVRSPGRWAPAPRSRSSPTGSTPRPGARSPPHDPPNTVTIASVMRLTRRKRPMPLLRMLRRLRDRVSPNIELRAVIIGDGPLRDAMAGYLRSHDMESWVSHARAARASRHQAGLPPLRPVRRTRRTRVLRHRRPRGTDRRPARDRHPQRRRRRVHHRRQRGLPHRQRQRDGPRPHRAGPRPPHPRADRRPQPRGAADRELAERAGAGRGPLRRGRAARRQRGPPTGHPHGQQARAGRRSATSAADEPTAREPGRPASATSSSRSTRIPTTRRS